MVLNVFLSYFHHLQKNLYRFLCGYYGITWLQCVPVILSTHFIVGEGINCFLLHNNCYLPLSATGLPCSCPDRFIPVCASNGRTYPSACVARCMGFKDHQFVFGQCHLSNPCADKPCQRNQRWVRLLISPSFSFLSFTLHLFFCNCDWQYVAVSSGCGLKNIIIVF